MTHDDPDRTARIAALNDRFRTTFTGGKIYTTDAVAGVDDATRAALLTAVQAFTAFTADNDPYGEHDFGAVDVDGAKYFWKIDYYDVSDPDLGADDPADAATTARVLTIMLAEEY